MRIESHQLVRQMLLQPCISHLALPSWRIGVIQQRLFLNDQADRLRSLAGTLGVRPQPPRNGQHQVGPLRNRRYASFWRKASHHHGSQMRAPILHPANPLVHVTPPCSGAIQQQRGGRAGKLRTDLNLIHRRVEGCCCGARRSCRSPQPLSELPEQRRRPGGWSMSIRSASRSLSPHLAPSALGNGVTHKYVAPSGSICRLPLKLSAYAASLARLVGWKCHGTDFGGIGDEPECRGRGILRIQRRQRVRARSMIDDREHGCDPCTDDNALHNCPPRQLTCHRYDPSGDELGMPLSISSTPCGGKRVHRSHRSLRCAIRARTSHRETIGQRAPTTAARNASNSAAPALKLTISSRGEGPDRRKRCTAIRPSDSIAMKTRMQSTT